MSGIAISCTATMLTIGISLFVTLLIKIMVMILGQMSRPVALPAIRVPEPAESPSRDESDVAAVIAITKSLQKPFPLNY